MKPSGTVSLLLQTRLDSSNVYPLRILKYDNMYIDELHQLSPAVSDEGNLQVETQALTDTQQAEFNTLLAAHDAFIEAKQIYMSAVDTFWKSKTGALCVSMLAPDPDTQDRAILYLKIKELETRLQKTCLSIKHQNVEFYGYNCICARYVVTMLETQEPPHIFAEFRLESWKSKPLEEFPKIWTNKMALDRKKEMELIYVYGHVLPPYRISDSERIKSNHV